MTGYAGGPAAGAGGAPADTTGITGGGPNAPDDPNEPDAPNASEVPAEPPPTEGLLNPTGPEGCSPTASRFSSCTALRPTCSTSAPGSHPAATRRAAPSGASRRATSPGVGRSCGDLTRQASTTSRNSPLSDPSSGSSCTTL